MNERKQAIVPAVVAALWSFVVLDFLVHAVVLASWWRATQAFWLPPLELAKRIPFAYSAFAIYSVGLCLFLKGAHREQLRVLTGLRLGALVGFAFGLMSALGWYSAVRIPASFLVVGPVSTAICSAGAGGAAAWVLGGVRRWRRVGIVVVVGFVVFLLGVVAQNALPTGP